MAAKLAQYKPHFYFRIANFLKYMENISVNLSAVDDDDQCAINTLKSPSMQTTSAMPIYVNSLVKCCMN